MAESGATGFANLCIVTAVDIEFSLAVKLLSDKSFSEDARMKICRGLFGGRRVTVLQSQIGANGFAERLAGHLSDNHYDALVVVGLAGGLDPRLRVGDAVAYDFCYDARAIDLERIERSTHEKAGHVKTGRAAGDAALSNRLFAALTSAGLSCVQGAGMTVSKIVTASKDKMTLNARFGAAAVDMESYEAISACARFNLPAATLRVISDEAGRDLPDFNRAYDADGRMNGPRMAAAMIARPVASFRFLKGLRRALNSLKKSLVVVLST
jgi:nucleoside phosphorylase